MHAIRIDRIKSLAEEPHLGHNRYHPDVPPVLHVDEGEEVALETRDALDGQIKPNSTVTDFSNLNTGAIHPLTGPVFVKGAKPGDMLEIEFLDILPQLTAFSAIVPGLGFLRDIMTAPFLAHWTIRDGWATSDQIPGVRIPGAPFMGVSAVAPSASKLAEWSQREQRVIDKGGMALPPIRPARYREEPVVFTAFAPFPHAKTVAISTSSSLRREPSCFFRCSWTALCFRPATRISRKGTAKSASPQSRWAQP